MKTEKVITKEDIKNSKLINHFVLIYKNKGTQRSYKSCLISYFLFISKQHKIHPDDYFKNPKRDYGKDVWDYLIFYISKLTPGTLSGHISTVNMFFIENDIELSKKFLKNVERKLGKTAPKTDDAVPTPKEFKRMMSHAPLRAEALFFISISSGTRISEILGLEYDDIHRDEVPVRVNIRAEIAKNEKRRTTFISHETKQFLDEWLTVRDAFIITAIKKSAVTRRYYMRKGFELLKQKNGEYIVKKDGKEVDITKHDKRVFPFSYATANALWNNILKKSGMDKRDENTQTRFHVYHIHVLKKFFRTYTTRAGMPDVVAMHLSGQHGYLAGSYDRLESDKVGLGETYEKYVHTITIYGADDERIKSMEEKSAKYEHIIAEQKVNDSENSKEIQKLREDLKKSNEKFDKLNEKVDKFLSEREEKLEKKLSEE